VSETIRSTLYDGSLSPSSDEFQTVGPAMIATGYAA